MRRQLNISSTICPLQSLLPGAGDEYVVLVTTRDELFASACAIARVYPEYNMKTLSATPPPRTVTVEVDGKILKLFKRTLASIDLKFSMVKRICCAVMKFDKLTAEFYPMSLSLSSPTSIFSDHPRFR